MTWPVSDLPGAPFIAYRGETLFMDDLPLQSLAHRFGTPLYVYARRAMLAALRPYQQALRGRDHLICYAMKANPSLSVLQTFAQAGCGFDIVSGGELERVLAIGADPASVVFSGVGKTRAEMRQALQAGVLCFNVESEAELAALSAVAGESGSTARVSLRVNPDVDAETHPYISTGLKGNKFGIAHERAIAAYRLAAGLPGIAVGGIDFHIGSQILQARPYLDALDRLLDLVEAVEALGIPIHHLDLGGGLGIRYADEVPPPANVLITALLARLDARGHGHRRLLLEPGRSLVGNAGVLLSEVLYTKAGAASSGRSPGWTAGDDGENEGRGGHDEGHARIDAAALKNFCVVDAAMNDLLRPALYEAWMHIVACTRRDEPPLRWDVVGPICESGDWLGRDRQLAVRAGDIVAVLSAGAYGMSMASNYNSRGRAAELMVDGDQAWLIRNRERPSELFSGELLLL